MTGRMLAFDFREGGSYRLRLSYNEQIHVTGKTSAHTDEVEVRFLRLFADRRIEQAARFDTASAEFSAFVDGATFTQALQTDALSI
jgi:hypothetical protein